MVKPTAKQIGTKHIRPMPIPKPNLPSKRKPALSKILKSLLAKQSALQSTKSKFPIKSFFH